MENTAITRSELTSDVLKLLQYSSYFENSCKIILEKLTGFADAAAASIAVLSGTTLTAYEYTADGGKLFSFQNQISESRELYPGISDKIQLSGIAYRDATSVSGSCDSDFDKIGWAVSFVHGIKIDGKISAYIIVCDDDKNKVWSNDIIAAVCDFGKILAGLLQSQTTQQELDRTNLTFKTVVDNIDSYVFVVDPDTERIIFSNEKFNDLFGATVVGKAPEKLLGKEFVISLKSCEEQDDDFEFCFEKTEQWFDVSDTEVTWINGKAVRLVTLNDISEKMEYERRIENQIYYDILTKLPNRRRLEKDFEVYVADSLRTGRNAYVMFIDLDDFKNINDARGHNFGDLHLKEVARFLSSFEKDGAVPYRFGGDEFILIIPAGCSMAVSELAEIIKGQFNNEWNIHGNCYYCTASVGVTEFPEKDDSFDDVLRRVDMALLHAKKSGKNSVETYHSGIGNEILRGIEMERCMRADINDNFRNFEVHYQPIINSQTQQLDGCEALLRWNCDSLGRVSPGEFIPVAEKNGFISDLGEFVLKEASAQCKKWVDMGFDIRVNINLSVGQLAEPDFLEKVKRIISETKVSYTNITLEVTESMAINDMQKMKELLGDIADLGICIALDDFGTGYSSLNCLKEMPLSTIKIDKTFIDDIVGNPYTAMFVKTIVNLSHDLKMKVCAEGVEEKEQFDLLKGLQTDVIQGFYFGRPIAPPEFEEKFLGTKANS